MSKSEDTTQDKLETHQQRFLGAVGGRLRLSSQLGSRLFKDFIYSYVLVPSYQQLISFTVLSHDYKSDMNVGSQNYQPIIWMETKKSYSTKMLPYTTMR